MNFAWRPDVVSRYDSLWALFHRFAHLNGVRYSDIGELFIRGGRTKSAVDLRNFWWLREEELAHAFEIPEPQIALSIPGAFQLLDHEISCSYLRYCPACMLRGFHAAAFQLEWIKCCPVHGEELMALCPMCGNGIRYFLGSKEVAVPFGCQCGHVLWPGLHKLSEWQALEPQNEHVFDELHLWVTRIRLLQSHGHWREARTSMRGMTCIEPIAGWPPESFDASSSDVIEWICETRSEPVEAFQQPAPVDVLGPWLGKLSFEGGSDWWPRQYRVRLKRDIRNVMAAVKRLLAPHGRCIAKEESYGDHVNICDEDACVWAAAYRDWKSDVEKLYKEVDVLMDGVYRDNAGLEKIYFRAAVAILGENLKLDRHGGPEVQWLMEQLVRARVLHEFVLSLARSGRGTRRTLPIIGGFEEFPYVTRDPMVAYYPCTRLEPAKVRVYLGTSFRRLAQLLDSGAGCERGARKRTVMRDKLLLGSVSCNNNSPKNK